jgi:hypothetical protein
MTLTTLAAVLASARRYISSSYGPGVHLQNCHAISRPCVGACAGMESQSSNQTARWHAEYERAYLSGSAPTYPPDSICYACSGQRCTTSTRMAGKFCSDTLLSSSLIQPDARCSQRQEAQPRFDGPGLMSVSEVGTSCISRDARCCSGERICSCCRRAPVCPAARSLVTVLRRLPAARVQECRSNRRAG